MIELPTGLFTVAKYTLNLFLSGVSTSEITLFPVPTMLTASLSMLMMTLSMLKATATMGRLKESMLIMMRTMLSVRLSIFADAFTMP